MSATATAGDLLVVIRRKEASSSGSVAVRHDGPVIDEMNLVIHDEQKCLKIDVRDGNGRCKIDVVETVLMTSTPY